jgi:hypothetical protein
VHATPWRLAEDNGNTRDLVDDQVAGFPQTSRGFCRESVPTPTQNVVVGQLIASITSPRSERNWCPGGWVQPVGLPVTTAAPDPEPTQNETVGQDTAVTEASTSNPLRGLAIACSARGADVANAEFKATKDAARIAASDTTSEPSKRPFCIPTPLRDSDEH